ncbi:MAG: DUF4143 domain-containing protein [Streptococcaceae bacterium]|jgi:predicted AAA+ superfamily ATPase|nr:DUF4143 domain-containing protein [Streptococcaceae bacterium]
MDNDVTRTILLADPEGMLNEEIPILIDEWQLAPSLWNFVRHQVDKGLKPGSVLFTGSSIRINAKIHSGAGRIIRMKMRPFSIEERSMNDTYIRVTDLFSIQTNQKISGKTDKKMNDYLTEIYLSGFPGIRKMSERLRKKMIASYIENISEHEFEQNGFPSVRPESLNAWMRAYAAAIATTTQFQTIIDSAMANNEQAPTRPTATSYREALQKLYIIDEVPSFLGFGKLFPNLAKSSKHFMLDPAIALSLLGVERENLENYHVPHHVGKLNQTFIGQLLESLVYQSLVVYAQTTDSKLYHLRENRGKREIDFILQRGNTLILFEVKADPEAKNSYVEHLNWVEERVKEEFKVVKVLLNTGPRAFTRSDGVHVVPISMLGV